MLDNIFEEICSFDNLLKAYKTVSNEHRYKAASLKFYNHLEENLIELQNELLWGLYKLGDFYTFVKYEPKRREINALPYRDRVVQSAVCNVIEPEITKTFIYDSYACIKEKGALKAANRISYFMGKKGTEYYLKCDITKYFYNVDLDVAYELYKRHISDVRTLNLISQILHKDNPEKGIKIGNRLSQLTANLYLNELDRFIKHNLKIKYYVRYMDDFILFGSKAQLVYALREIVRFLREELHLELNDKTVIDKSSRGVEFVGYKIYPKGKRIKKQTVYRTRRFVTKFINGGVEPDSFCRSMASICGHAVHTDNYMFYIRQLMRVIRHLCDIND